MFLDEFEDKQDQLFNASAAQAEPQRGVAAELLSIFWRISLDEAKQTLQATTQLNKQDGDSRILRRPSTNNRIVQYKRTIPLFYMDTFHSKVKSKKSLAMMQLFVSGEDFVKV